MLARALAKEPEDRYPSAGDFGRAALAAAEGRSVTEEERSVARGAAAPTIRHEDALWAGPPPADDDAAAPDTSPLRTYRTRKRPRWLIVGAATALATGAIAAAAIPGGDTVPPPGAPVERRPTSSGSRTRSRRPTRARTPRASRAC